MKKLLYSFCQTKKFMFRLYSIIPNCSYGVYKDIDRGKCRFLIFMY